MKTLYCLYELFIGKNQINVTNLHRAMEKGIRSNSGTNRTRNAYIWIGGCHSSSKIAAFEFNISWVTGIDGDTCP